MPGADDDLTPILTDLVKASPEVTFRQGLVMFWDPQTGDNVIDVGGGEITNLPTLVATEKLAIQAGNAVGILKIRSQYFILGRITFDEGAILVRDNMGNITVQIRRTGGGGGEISTYHPDGDSHVFMGQMYVIATGEIVGNGFQIKEDNGTNSVYVGPLTPGSPPVVRLRDKDGALCFNTKQTGGWELRAPGGGFVVMATDDTDPRLLARPYEDVPMYNSRINGSAANGVPPPAPYDTVWQGRMHVTHPALFCRIWAKMSNAGATADLQVVVDDIHSFGVANVNSTTRQVYDLGPTLLPQAVRDKTLGAVEIKIRTRMTSGAGTVECQPYGIQKRGTP